MRTTHLNGPRLSLTRWADAEMSIEDQERLTRRCAELDVRVGVIQTRSGWTVRVSRGTTVVKDGYGLKGAPAGNIDALLNEYEATLFTADEIVTIAAQSGIAVSRA
jgi:hypothetical protein